MGLFDDEAEILLNNCLAGLKKHGFDIVVFNRGRIKRAFGPGLYKSLKGALRQAGSGKFLLMFDGKELRMSWPLDLYQDRVAINLVRGVGTIEFINSIKMATAKLQELESITKELKHS